MARSKKKGIMILRQVIDSINMKADKNVNNLNKNELIVQKKPIKILIDFDNIRDSGSFFVRNIKYKYDLVCDNNTYKKNNNLETSYMKKNKINNN